MSLTPIRFELEEPTGRARQRWPVSRGVPFPQGTLRDDTYLRLRNDQGQLMPLQTRPLGHWPDGTLRWVLLHFQADLNPQARHPFTLEIQAAAEPVLVAAPVQVQRSDEQLVIETGPLRATFPLAGGAGLPNQVWLDGRPMLTGNANGFEIVDGNGVTYSSVHGQVESVTIEETGPLRATVCIRGDHRTPQGQRLFGYCLRWYAFAGHPWLELEYTFVNDADPISTLLQRIGFGLPPSVGAQPRGLCGAYYEFYESADDFSLLGDAASSDDWYAGLRRFDQRGNLIEAPYAGELSRGLVHPWIDLSGDTGGVCLSLHRANELNPKRLALTNREIQADLWPTAAGPLDWHQGMARTHKALLHFHPGDGRAARVNEVSVCYEQDLKLWAPGWYVESGALGPLLPHLPERYPNLEIALRDQHSLWHGSNRPLGFTDFGDHPQHGGLARRNYMANNEYDLAHCFALQYARVGEELYWSDTEAAAWHLMDVDVVHHTTFDPVELGGARIHGDGHVQYHCEAYENVSITSSHMWTEGLLAYYCLSGHPRALEIARGIGQCILRLLDRGWPLMPHKVHWHGPRDTGWPLIALSALYEATLEAQWLEGARRIAENFLEMQAPDGAWDMWWGFHRTVAPMQMGVAMTGLSRYHQLTGDERVRGALIRAADAVLRECTFPDGSLMATNEPGLRMNYRSGAAIEPLGYIWYLTGDERYLHAGRLAHRYQMADNIRTGTSLAAAWRGNLRYMAWAHQAGLLTDLPG